MVRLSLSNILNRGKQSDEGSRIDKALVKSLSSRFPVMRNRMKNQIITYGKNNPYEMVGILLEHFNNEQKGVSENVEDCLDKLTSSRVGKDALFFAMENPNREVRRNVREYFSKKGDVYARTYASLYAHTMTLLHMARRKDIPAEDIRSLIKLSKRTFLDGGKMGAIEDISTSLDLLKRRLRTVEQLKSYVRDMLKLVPELERMGVYSSNLEEPLRQAVKVSKSREFDETSNIMEERELELEIKGALEKIGDTVMEHGGDVMDIAPSELEGVDVWIVARLDELIESATSKTLARDKRASLRVLREFLCRDFKGYTDEILTERVQDGDAAALFTLYTAGITCLKLASAVVPNTAEGVYQRYFRDIEGEPTIHVVSWPDLALSEE